jgi:hypothetical protein
MNFGADGPQKIITRANLKASLHAYEEVKKTELLITQCSLAYSLSPENVAHEQEREVSRRPFGHGQGHFCFRGRDGAVFRVCFQKWYAYFEWASSIYTD